VNFLDWFLVVLVLAYAVSGYWQGFISGAFATAGLLLGGLLGILVAPKLLGDAAPALWVSLAALFVVLVCASFGQALFQFAGSRIRDKITWQPARVEGTGFLYSPTRLMTNAHVVAGVDEPSVLVGETEVPARVVYYNSDLDVAVLALDQVGRPFLRFDTGGAERQAGAVLGYPEDGPYDVQAARIRGEQRLRSPDIYGQGTVIREVFSIRSLVRPGNSGGPLVSDDGRVLGVIFAASVTDDDTGYALTSEQVRESAAQGVTSDETVDTGRCA